MTKIIEDIENPARLELDQVCAGYGRNLVIQDLTLSIKHGDKVAVVGPNGAGKSTLFKVLVGLLPVYSGRVSIHGLPMGSHQDCVAYVPQRGEVDWKFPVTVQDVVMMGRYGKLGLLQQPGAGDKIIVKESLHQLGISDLVSRSFGELSGGQQQRVFLARALTQQPHILLMDEPFTGVDIATQEATMDLIDELNHQGVTVLVSTHDLNLAKERFNDILLLNHQLIGFGSPREVLNPENIRAVFGGKVLFMNGNIIVDDCCPGENDRSPQERSR